MPEPDFAGLRAAAENAATPPGFEAVRRRATQVRARRRLVAVTAVAMAVAVITAGIGQALGALTGTPGPLPGTATPGPVVTFPTGSATPSPQGQMELRTYTAAGGHLYALVGACPEAMCPGLLRASDDGGATWQTRPLPTPIDETETGAVFALGPETLWLDLSRAVDLGRLPPDNGTRSAISVDGGRTWQQPRESSKPIPAVAPGYRPLGCVLQRKGCTVRAVDPATGVIGPLAHQPDLVTNTLVSTRTNAGLWASGFDPSSRRPAVAVSHDGGVTWTKHVFDGERPAVTATEPPFAGTLWGPITDIVTADGRTAYAMVYGPQSDDTNVYRTTDGGATWAHLAPGPTGKCCYWGIDRDGDLVALTMTAGGMSPYVSRNGGPYEVAQFVGITGMVWAPEPIDGGFAAYADNDPALYLSDDGWHYRRVPVT